MQVGDFFQLPPIHDKVKQFVEDSEELETKDEDKKNKKPYVSQKRAQFCFEYNINIIILKNNH